MCSLVNELKDSGLDNYGREAWPRTHTLFGLMREEHARGGNTFSAEGRTHERRSREKKLFARVTITTKTKT